MTLWEATNGDTRWGPVRAYVWHHDLHRATIMARKAFAAQGMATSQLVLREVMQNTDAPFCTRPADDRWPTIRAYDEGDPTK